MAYEVQEEDDNNQNNGGNGQQQGGGEGGIISGETDLQGRQNSQTPGSGAFTNIQQFLQANQDQTAGLADRLANPIETKAAGARSGATQAKNQFKGLVDQGSVTYDRGLVEDLIPDTNVQTYQPWQKNSSKTGLATTLNPNANLVQSSMYDNRARKLATDLNQQQKDRIAQMRDARYSGPQNIETTDLLTPSRGLAREATDLGNLTQSEGGRFSLLQKVINDPSYVRGEQRLDQALLQQSPEARARLSQARDVAVPLMGEMDAATNESNALVDPARQMTDETRINTNQGLQNAVGGYNTLADKRAQNIKGYNQDLVSQAQQELAGNKVTTAVKNKFGISGNDALPFRLNLNDYLKAENPEIDRYNSVTHQGADQLGALSELAQIEDQITDPSQVDTALGKKAYGFNDTDYQQALGNEKTAYDKYLGYKYNELYGKSSGGLLPSSMYGTVAGLPSVDALAGYRVNKMKNGIGATSLGFGGGFGGRGGSGPIGGPGGGGGDGGLFLPGDPQAPNSPRFIPPKSPPPPDTSAAKAKYKKALGLEKEAAAKAYAKARQEFKLSR